MKKIISTVLSCVMLFSVNTTAFAADDASPSTEPSSNIVYSEPLVYDDYLNGNMRSTSKPTKFYDLLKSDYNANLELVGEDWLYTNYYFYGNSEGELHVTYTVYSNTGRAAKLKIGLYDLDDKRMETSWTSSGSTLAGITESFYFYNLDKTHKYAVAFTSVYDGLTHEYLHGSAVISH